MRRDRRRPARDAPARGRRAGCAQAGVASPEVRRRGAARPRPRHHAGPARRSSTRSDDGRRDRYDALVARRAAREPLQHLTGTRRVPARRAGGRTGGLRAPTGDRAARRLGGRPGPRGGSGDGQRPVVVDLCTGSGAIALASPTRCPTRRVHAVELDAGGLRLGASATWPAPGSTCATGDMAEALPRPRRHRRRGGVQPAVHPARGLRVGRPRGPRPRPGTSRCGRGEDGLDAMRVVEAVAARLLRPGGWVGAEHADVQGESAPAVFAGTGRWTDVRDHEDLAGRPRLRGRRGWHDDPASMEDCRREHPLRHCPPTAEAATRPGSPPPVARRTARPARRAAHRHRVRRRRRRLQRRGGAAAARRQGPRPARCRRRCWSRADTTLEALAAERPGVGRAPGRGVLARAADPGVPPAAERCSGTSARPGAPSRCGCRDDEVALELLGAHRPAGGQPRPTSPAARRPPTPTTPRTMLGCAVEVVLDGGPSAGPVAVDDRRLHRRPARGCCARARSSLASSTRRSTSWGHPRTDSEATRTAEAAPGRRREVDGEATGPGRRA